MNEADISIDIHTAKLQDWLISRRIVPKNIQPYIKDIRSKISNALQDMPSNEQLIKLLSGASINYYHCKEIVEILKQTEKDTKSIFGSYGSQRMKDWQQIVQLYEKDNIYLAESAQIFVRNINYEIPAAKKQQTKLLEQSDDARTRVQNLKKREQKLLNERSEFLRKLGVKGENLREEFIETLKQLPEMYAQSIKDIGTLKEAVQYYADMSKNPECLPIIRHLIEFGNTTVYQYIHKEAPLAIEEMAIVIELSDDLAKLDETAEATNEIDFGPDDNGDSATVSVDGIDFGDVPTDEPAPAAETGGDIDWGIETTPTDAKEVDLDLPLEDYGIVVEEAGMDGGIAKGKEAYTILDSPKYREKFIDDLYELHSFLKMRVYELNRPTDPGNILLTLLDSMTSHDLASARKLLKAINAVLKAVEDENTYHFIQLKHSPQYAEVLANKLKLMMYAVEKVRTTRQQLEKRAEELKEQSKEITPVIEQLIKETKELQNHIEHDISKRYKNRVVNMLGGATAL